MVTEIEQRYREAEQRLVAHVEYMRKREEEFCTPQELGQLQRLHWHNLNIWSGLKDAWEKSTK